MELDIGYTEIPKKVRDWIDKELSRPGIILKCERKEFKHLHFLTPKKMKPYRITIHMKAEEAVEDKG